MRNERETTNIHNVYHLLIQLLRPPVDQDEIVAMQDLDFLNLPDPRWKLLLQRLRKNGNVCKRIFFFIFFTHDLELCHIYLFEQRKEGIKYKLKIM